jgi:hypothetical protein
LRNDEVIGALAVNSVKPDGSSDSQVALVQTFTEQAVIAITSAERFRCKSAARGCAGLMRRTPSGPEHYVPD